MPPKRVYRPKRYRKRNYRPKRRFNKYRKVTTSTQVHKFSRFATPSGFPIQGNAAYTPLLGTSQSFNLAQLPSSSDFSNLYDQYRITHVQFRFKLRIDPSAQTAGTAIWPTLYYVRDHDDAASISSLNDLKEYSKCKQVALSPMRWTVINIKPSILDTMFRNTGQTTFVSKPAYKQWIDMAYTDVAHYGLKWGVDVFTNTSMYIDAELKMWFQCKTSR